MDKVQSLRAIAEEGYRFAGEAADEIERLRAELAASQAREKVLREWLISLDASAMDDDTHYYYFSLRDPESLDDLFALPTDDTALREMLTRAQEEMRERCTKEAHESWIREPDESPMHAIRALEVKL